MRTRNPLSKLQMVCIILLWVLIVMYILAHAEIDGPLVLSLVISGVLVLVPIYKTIRKRSKKN
ncbi:hypothetical protein HQ38_08180 [Porphyromonas crevioricanis]|uniref:Uncharacterized protein n=2 Tax=Porphyromonas crevioricanis TaxID=393921 RepID=A0AB34PFF3_9PORP|nr:hypothetical protein HQ38_08180 [Porphyromonas crevioricanis]